MATIKNILQAPASLQNAVFFVLHQELCSETKPLYEWICRDYSVKIEYLPLGNGRFEGRVPGNTMAVVWGGEEEFKDDTPHYYVTGDRFDLVSDEAETYGLTLFFDGEAFGMYRGISV